MKKFKNIEEFENLLKDNLGNHSVPAPADVWSGVSSSIAGNSGGVLSQFTSYFSSISNIVKVAFFVSGISAVGVVLYDENTKDKSVETLDATIEKVEALDETNLINDDATSETLSLNKENTQLPSNSKNDVSSNQLEQNSISGQSSNVLPFENSTQNNTIPAKNDISKASESGNKTATFKNIHVVLSNNKPCIGEKITLSNSVNQKGDWYVNGTKVSTNKSYVNYVWSSNENTLVEFKYDSITVRKNIASAATNTKIVSSNSTNDNYLFNLDDPNIIANWYVNGSLIATNAKQLKFDFDKVGMHHIKAVPINHACSTPVEMHVTIKPRGEIKTYTFFSPNGDGKNDSYIVEISNYEMYSIQIFNSQNVKVFASNNPSISWDGTEFNSGKECSNGEYAAKIVYKLIGEETTIKNIKLTLIRN